MEFGFNNAVYKAVVASFATRYVFIAMPQYCCVPRCRDKAVATYFQKTSLRQEVADASFRVMILRDSLLRKHMKIYSSQCKLIIAYQISFNAPRH